MQFPPIVLNNPYFLGDSVLLEGIADTLSEVLKTDVYVSSNYPELFIGHPCIKGLSLDASTWPRDMRVVNLSNAIRSIKDEGGKQIILPDKVGNMYKAAGLSASNIKPSKLYLTQEEQNQASTLRKLLPPRRIGVALESRHKFKSWPYVSWLIRSLTREGVNVFAFGININKSVSRLPVFRVINKPLREAMIYLSLMDVVVGPDTGLMHIAAALQIPIIVMLRDFFRDIYDSYENCEVISTRTFNKYSMYAIGPKKPLEAVRASYKVRKVKQKYSVALFRLDGLGGTVTMSDHARKIFEMTGLKSTIITRGYRELFDKNPYIDDVVEVGYVKWADSMEEMKTRYDILAEIRFAPAKWHQNGDRVFEQDFSSLEGIFDQFPRNYRQFEAHGLNHVQVTDKILGLPYDTIDTEVYRYDVPSVSLPSEYIVVASGVDSFHKGMRQTKVWEKWDELTKLVDLPFIQVGTMYDPTIQGAIDLRGKTTVPELLYMMQKAKAVVCTEGGMMHLAYAVRCPNVVVLRGPTCGKLFEYPGQVCVDSYVCNNCWSVTDDWYMRCAKGLKNACMDSISAKRVVYHLERMLHGL